MAMYAVNFILPPGGDYTKYNFKDSEGNLIVSNMSGTGDIATSVSSAYDSDKAITTRTVLQPTDKSSEPFRVYNLFKSNAVGITTVYMSAATPCPEGWCLELLNANDEVIERAYKENFVEMDMSGDGTTLMYYRYTPYNSVKEIRLPDGQRISVDAPDYQEFARLCDVVYNQAQTITSLTSRIEALEGTAS